MECGLLEVQEFRVCPKCVENQDYSVSTNENAASALDKKKMER